MADPEKAISVLRHLNAMNVRVSIDDFARATGFFFAHPLPADELDVLLGEHLIETPRVR